MKLIEAEFIVTKKLNDDPVTEEEWLAAGKHYRMRARYLMTYVERSSFTLGWLYKNDASDAKSIIQTTMEGIEELTELLAIWSAYWPEMASDWSALERRAFKLHEEYVAILGGGDA